MWLFSQTKRRIRLKIGRLLQSLGHVSGLIEFTARIRRSEGAVVLMYHSVADDNQSEFIDPANHVSADVFFQQMEFLSRNRKVVDLKELVATLRQGKTPPAGMVAITFDDGYLDNLTIAASILDRYSLPATLFLPTGYIDRGETQWVDQAYSAFKFRGISSLTWGVEQATMFDLDNPAQYRAAYQAVCGLLLTAGIEERRQLLTELRDQLKPTIIPPRLTMTWDEVRILIGKHRFFRIGGHTLEHTDLTSVSVEEAKNELTTCAQQIHEKLGVWPDYFSFCYGRNSESLRSLLPEAGFEAACGDGDGDPVIKSSADLFQLPRIAAPASMRRFDLMTSSANTGIWRRLDR